MSTSDGQAGKSSCTKWRSTDPVIHDLALRLGSGEIQQLEQHLLMLEWEADQQDFLCLNEEAGDGVEEPDLDRRETAESDAGAANEVKEVGPYRLMRLLGVGGFSRVYEAHHRDRPDQRVAVKLFQDRWLDALERLDIEKLVLQQLRHPNLVRVLDSGETTGGLSYLVLSLIEGRRIDEFVQSSKLQPRSIAELFIQLAEALDYAHSQDVIHRDLKPNNILVSSVGTPVIADFGLAKRLRLPVGQSVTVSGALVGTLGYLAPEQVGTQRVEVTRAVDIYGLGATLYAVLTGRPPTESENLLRGLQQLQHMRPPAPRSLNPDVPLELQLICFKCLEKLPSDRYGCMQELADDLRRFVAGRPVAARPPSTWTQACRWAAAHPAIASLTAALLVVATLGLAVALMLWQQAESKRLQADRLLNVARGIISTGNRMAENSLVQTAGSLEYRYNRLRQATAFLLDLVEQFPADQELKRELAVTHFRLAKVSDLRGFHAEAVQTYHNSRLLFQALAELDEGPDLQFDLFHCWLGEYHARAAIDYLDPENEDMLEEAYARIVYLHETYPENSDYWDAYCNTAPLIAFLLDDDARALELLISAHFEACSLKSQLPEPCLQWRHAGLTASGVAFQLKKSGRLEEAVEWLEKALELQADYLKRASSNPLEELDLLGMRYMQGELEFELGNQLLASQLHAEVLESLRNLVQQYPDYQNFKRSLDSWSKTAVVEPGK